MKSFGLSWVDFMVVVILLFGVVRGRKRGMSEELLDIIKWALIVVVAGILYEPTGKFLSQVSVFSLLSSYLFTYTGIALVIFIIFAFVRKRIGEKLMSSDTFGSGEYYLGMAAGAFRYFCIVLVAMAFLNARYYSPSEIKASARYQQDNFGSQFFVTMPDLQREVFDDSLCGRAAQSFLHVVLIRPTAPAEKGLASDNSIARRREGTMNEILDKK
jgi:uncharacterized membrane protein required for colicin V production